MWGYPHITGMRSLRSLFLARFLRLFSFSVLRCVSWHISTPVYQSFYRLITAVSPSERGSRRCPLAHKHLQGLLAGGWEEGWGVGGGGDSWLTCFPLDVNDLNRYRIRLRLIQVNYQHVFPLTGWFHPDKLKTDSGAELSFCGKKKNVTCNLCTISLITLLKNMCSQKKTNVGINTGAVLKRVRPF